jgi:hypothetical protein
VPDPEQKRRAPPPLPSNVVRVALLLLQRQFGRLRVHSLVHRIRLTPRS